MDNLLEIKNLSKTYYTVDKEILAIKNVDFKIEEDSIVAIVGPSGCGKSTLLNIIGNLDTKTNGEIIFKNNKNNIGYMFQNDCLFPWLTILDNCLIGLKIKRKITNTDKEYVIDLLKNYGLEDFIYSYPSSLSGGMRQRVGCMVLRHKKYYFL